jgi:UDP-N-acetylglucosamine--N-acetylmuramyl-(pentapeptide) pyrophosphoryl-undecaprenol N-acetylglucosamine transferase
VNTSDRPVALLCTSNGVGLGHLTRQMAVARALEDRFRPVIFTLSGAVAVPVAEGFAVEHLPSAGHGGVPTAGWHDLLGDRVDHLIRTLQPAVVTFDGVHPYAGFVAALSAHRRRTVPIWQRRAMWRAGIGAEALAMSSSFDAVIEPGEYASDYDTGATLADRDRSTVSTVAPVVYDSGRLDRDEACADLGLDPQRINVAVQLGAGAINDVTGTTGSVVAALRSRDVTVVVGRSVLGGDSQPTTARTGPEHDARSRDVIEIRRFPLSRWFAAFDAAVFAAGYNSYHESLAAGLPTLFVPNLETRTDDQDARARFAQDRGLGWRWDGHDRDELATLIADLLDSSRRDQARMAMAELPPATGAPEIASVLEGLVR